MKLVLVVLLTVFIHTARTQTTQAGPVNVSASGQNGSAVDECQAIRGKHGLRRSENKQKKLAARSSKAVKTHERHLHVEGEPRKAFLELGCASWEADCDHSQDNKYCVKEEFLDEECDYVPPLKPLCGENEEFVECPHSPDAYCEIITWPLGRKCDLTKSCKSKADCRQANYCRLLPRCMCKDGYVRRNIDPYSKCVPEMDCFEPPCTANSHYDRCPHAADLTCEKVHLPKDTSDRAMMCLSPRCVCDEGYVRAHNGSSHCILATKCKKQCGKNEHYSACPKCEDVECDQLVGNNRPHDTVVNTSGLRRGIDYCAQPGCKCDKGHARTVVNGQSVCVREHTCPGVPKDYKYPENDTDDCF